MSDGEAGWFDSSRPAMVGLEGCILAGAVHAFRLSPRRPLESRVNDGGSMPVPGRCAAYGQSVTVIFRLAESGAGPIRRCSRPSAGLPSSSNQRTRRLSMLSIKHRALELS